MTKTRTGRERCEKLVKFSARIVRHGRYVVFQLAAVAVPPALFLEILRRNRRAQAEAAAARSMSPGSNERRQHSRRSASMIDRDRSKV
jgi:hypothetical protein